MKAKAIDKGMLNRIKIMANRTWEYVAADWLELCGGSCSKTEVMEVVMDADRMLNHGEDKEAYEFYNKLDYRIQERIIKSVFKYSRYS